jgi:hypothetical protein
VTVNPIALPLPEGAKFTVDPVTGSYSVVNSNNQSIEGATFAFLYTGRTNGVTGMNTNYPFMTYSNSNAPTAPGFYRVSATAGGAYEGSLAEDYAISGPLIRTIELSRTAGTATNNFSRALLMSNVQRVSTNFTVLTGHTGLAWTNAVAGSSTVFQGQGPTTTTNPNTVVLVTSNTLRLIPASSNSINDTFGVTISDGTTPIAFPVIVTTTNAQAGPALQAQRVVDGTNGTKRAVFMTRPGRALHVYYMDPDTGQFRPITTTNVPVITPTNQPPTNAVIRPHTFAPPTGVLELNVQAGVQFFIGRATNK